MDHSAQDRERAVQAITRRNVLEKRIKRTQRRMAALQGEARQALEDTLAADQSALSEAIQTMEEVKADMRQEEEHRRWELQEALHCQDELKRRRFLHTFSNGSVPPSPGQLLGFLAVLAAMAAIGGGMLLLNR